MGFSLQFKTVLKKNLLISWRNKDILKENGFPFFAGILLFLVSKKDLLICFSYGVNCSHFQKNKQNI